MQIFLMFLYSYVTIAKCGYITTERAELIYVNETVVKDMIFKFGKFNRTIFALNASYTLLRDFPDGKIMATVNCDRFYHNEYRFGGLSFTANACDVWKTNVFHIIDQFRKAGWVIDACNIKKGFYKITNFILEPQYYPKHIPLGQWRARIKCFHKDSGDIFDVLWYVNVKSPDP